MSILNLFKRKNRIDIEPGNVILAGNSGDDYDVLNKVNRNIKAAAVAELPETSNIDEAAGLNLLPGNKYWVLLSLGFKAIDKNTWKHPMIDQPIQFDIVDDDLPRFASRLFKLGYHQSKHELIYSFKKLFELR